MTTKTPNLIAPEIVVHTSYKLCEKIVPLTMLFHFITGDTEISICKNCIAMICQNIEQEYGKQKVTELRQTLFPKSTPLQNTKIIGKLKL